MGGTVGSDSKSGESTADGKTLMPQLSTMASK